MATLLLRLAGPLQSWGDGSRFNRRKTRTEPTKSGVFGLLAAAQGRRRTDPIEDLLSLKFGVRCEQPGKILRDFQTEIDWRNGKAFPLTHRYYLSDAVFLAAIEGHDNLIEALHDALLNPVFPLFLGRRSCPPSGRIVVGLRDDNFVDVLHEEPIRASRHYLMKLAPQIRREITRDALDNEQPHEAVRDVPISFDIRNRSYGIRNVVREYSSLLENMHSKVKAKDDFMLLAKEVANVSEQTGS